MRDVASAWTYRAAASPQQRSHRIAAGDRIHQPLQRLLQGRVVRGQPLAAPCIGFCVGRFLGSEFLQTGANGSPRHTGRYGHARDPSAP